MQKLQNILNALFALPPDAVQAEEVALVGAVITLFNIHIGDPQRASLLALVFAAYLGVRFAYRAAGGK